MASKIIHKKSSVSGSVPVSSDLQPGELAVNLADRIIYSKTTGGDIIEMGVTDATTIIENCKNVSGGTLTKGTPVYQSGTAGNAMEVQAAVAGTAATMPAVGVLAQDLADQAEGTLVLVGFLNGIDTSSFAEGDTLYIAAAGGFTATPPSGELKSIQNIGKVLKVHASNGSIIITGAGRANATPNLNENRIFIGNSNGQASIEELNIDLLTDVDTTTYDGLQDGIDRRPLEAHVLTWNDDESLWEPRVIPTQTNVSLATWTLGDSQAAGWSVVEGGGVLVFKFGTTNAMTVDNSGNVDIAGDLYVNSGAIGGATDPDIGAGEWGYHDTSTNFYFQYGSTNKMRITSTGDLYIIGDFLTEDTSITGTSSSSYYFHSTGGAKLEIQTSGDVLITGDINTA